jgi:hypothetical protein
VLAAGLLISLCAADAIWLFGYELPRHPAPAAISVPLPGASESQLVSYDRAVDRDRLEAWTRERIVDSAITVPVAVALCIGIAALLSKTRSTE